MLEVQQAFQQMMARMEVLGYVAGAIVVVVLVILYLQARASAERYS